MVDRVRLKGRNNVNLIYKGDLALLLFCCPYFRARNIYKFYIHFNIYTFFIIIGQNISDLEMETIRAQSK